LQPPDCKILIEKLRACDIKASESLKDNSSHINTEASIISTLENVKSWSFGKCELYHWIDVLDIFDSVLQRAAETRNSSWVMACDMTDARGYQVKFLRSKHIFFQITCWMFVIKKTCIIFAI
jgi:hypothetical protein